ncbi:MAG: orotidine-5'-phosphate decarboxylase [Balneolaceae bacterium]
MTYLEKLEAAVQKSQSTLCVGLDPNLNLLPDQIRHNIGSSSELILHFCKKVIDATHEHCAAYKPNLAFFEAIGKKGLRVLSEVIEYIPDGHVVITDAKRGDISTTAEHYKKAFFKKFEADAITLNPLMGFETLDAFSEDETKGIYVLALTSNPGADDFLKKPFEGFDMMAEYIADKLFERSVKTEAHLGMVIGATQSLEARAVIEHHSKASLLIPGIGAQGGSIDELANTLAGHEGIPLINSSRGIIYAGSEEENWQEHVEQAAITMKEQLSVITQNYV